MRLARLILISLMGLAAAACVTSQAATPPPLDANGLLEALSVAGAEVESGGPVEQTFFTAPGEIIHLNGQDVQVFEYADAAAREAESSQIASDGGSIGTTMVTWIDQPNFFAKGRLIVLYVGRDPALISLLEGPLGESLTEPWPTPAGANLGPAAA